MNRNAVGVDQLITLFHFLIGKNLILFGISVSSSSISIWCLVTQYDLKLNQISTKDWIWKQSLQYVAWTKTHSHMLHGWQDVVFFKENFNILVDTWIYSPQTRTKQIQRQTHTRPETPGTGLSWDLSTCRHRVTHMAEATEGSFLKEWEGN